MVDAIEKASAGLLADTRALMNRARLEAENYKSSYQSDIPVKVMADRLSQFTQMYTLYGSVRPFGATALLGGVDHQGPQLYMIEPSGVSWGYFGAAAGKAATAAKTEIEKLKLSEMTARQAVAEAAKIIYKVHDEVKDKLFELELGWVCQESGNKHQLVPRELFEQAEQAAKDALRADQEMQDE
jgi:20S proteasome subunit alpha 7